VKVTASTTLTHNPWGEACWASGLRENLTSRSYGEGLETGRALPQVPRQSFTRQVAFKELKSGLPLGQRQVTTEPRRVERGLLLPILAYLLLLRLYGRDLSAEPGASIWQLKQRFTEEVYQEH
jgi:hypothetical protein